MTDFEGQQVRQGRSEEPGWLVEGLGALAELGTIFEEPVNAPQAWGNVDSMTFPSTVGADEAAGTQIGWNNTPAVDTTAQNETMKGGDK